jgi:hypothetical protein
MRLPEGRREFAPARLNEEPRTPAERMSERSRVQRRMLRAIRRAWHQNSQTTLSPRLSSYVTAEVAVTLK